MDRTSSSSFPYDHQGHKSNPILTTPFRVLPLWRDARVAPEMQFAGVTWPGDNMAGSYSYAAVNEGRGVISPGGSRGGSGCGGCGGAGFAGR